MVALNFCADIHGPQMMKSTETLNWNSLNNTLNDTLIRLSSTLCLLLINKCYIFSYNKNALWAPLYQNEYKNIKKLTLAWLFIVKLLVSSSFALCQEPIMTSQGLNSLFVPQSKTFQLVPSPPCQIHNVTIHNTCVELQQTTVSITVGCQRAEGVRRFSVE